MHEALTESLFHFDPLTLGVLLVGMVGGWYTLRNNSAWHTDWIKKHSAECDEQRRGTNQILTELKVSNAHLTTLTEGHEKRIDHLERIGR